MKSYMALLDGGQREQSISVKPLGPGLYEVWIGDEVHQVDALQLDNGTLSLIVDTQSYSVQLDQRSSEVRIQVRDSVYALELLDERRHRLRQAAARTALDGKQALVAPMPGKVVKVLTRVGAAVKAGQGLLVIEAMKMENEIKSPKTGTVLEIHVQEGQTIESGNRLADVE